MDSNRDKTEELAAAAYRKYSAVAAKYCYSFRRPAVTVHGVPCMLFLGNHSSGKSTIINWVLGGEPVQETGLAPTDDGFTVIVHGESEADVCGPAALAHLPAEFAALANHGAAFLQHLKVKIRNRELLKTVTLVDSPGMIDSAEGTVSRDYDFPGVVKLLAEMCDVVFFLLDPDKPGTTGETVTVFSKCLSGMEFKLRVLLNKCDAFSGVYDFARTYGTVCWNLARVLHTKDLPKIWTVYAGEDPDSSGFDLADCRRHRDEFRAVLADAAARRMDNIHSQALADFTGLSVRMRVVNLAYRRLIALGALMAAATGAAMAAGGMLIFRMLAAEGAVGKIAAAAAGAVFAAGAALLGFALARLVLAAARIVMARRADDAFNRLYRRSLAAADREDLRHAWRQIRDETARVIRDAPLRLPFFGEFSRRRLDAVTAKIAARRS